MTTPDLKPTFYFDRYINGVKMAEDVCVERASSLSAAMVVASKIASRGPNGEAPVLVYRAPVAAPNLKRIGTGLYEAQPAPDPAAIREAALREAAALCFKNADGITEAVSAFPQIKKRRVLLQRAEQAKVDAAAILALIQKRGDAYAVNPRHAPHEASPGVTAGAISKGDADDR